MARKLTTPDRVMLLMSLVPYLAEHGATPVSDLAKTFDVDADVLRGLVQFLATTGVPGETMAYLHQDLFDIDWVELEENDVVSLTNIIAVDDTPRFSSAETSALIAGLHELVPMLPKALRETARSTAAKLASVAAVDSRRAIVSVSEDAEDTLVAQVATAIDEGRRLSFEYRNASGDLALRRVEPLLLGQSGGSWYLRAYCLDRGAERTFLVDRMRDVKFDGVSTQKTMGASNSVEAVLDIHEPQVTATVLVRASALHRIADFTPLVIEDARPGWLRAEVALLHPAVAVRLVQASPGDIVIEAPVAAREAVLTWADQALAQYDA